MSAHNPTDYQWVPWVITSAALFYTILKDVLARIAAARQKDTSLEKRVLQLEVQRQVDNTKLDGDLALINQKLATTSGHVARTKELLQTALGNE